MYGACDRFGSPIPLMFSLMNLSLLSVTVDKICTLYSNAAKKSPGCEDILSHLFISYVRVNDFAAQQLVAMQLYKLKPKNPYYFWAVMSVYLKVHNRNAIHVVVGLILVFLISTGGSWSGQ